MINGHNSCEYLDDNKNVALIDDETHPLYIIKGEKNFLIDSGITAKAKKYYKTIAETFPNLEINTLLLTHSHFDHVGAASFLQDIYNFNIAGSHETVELLKNPDMIDMIDYQNQELKELFADHSTVKCEPLKKLAGLGNGDKLEVSPGIFIEAIACPGHSSCSLSFLLHPDMVLFTGDSAGMMEKNGEKRAIFFSGFKEYENTLLKLAALEPHILAFAHARYIKGKDNGKQYFEESLAAARKLKDRFLYDLMKGRNKIEIAENFLETGYIPASIMGSRDSYMMHLMAMADIIKKEFIKTNYR
ncbi:MAG: MBL fold metallo-hydrolase [Candidatus Aminicenantes bacterium]|nr:MBL fold metallo-hydrolase [Candidatus Aminicenantes bacterium]